MTNKYTFAPYTGGDVAFSPNVWGISSDDTIATVSSVDYFVAKLKSGLKVGDYAYITCEARQASAKQYFGKFVDEGNGIYFKKLIDGDALTWVPITPGDGWETTAEVAELLAGDLNVMRGKFTSTIDGNNNILGSFPDGFGGNFSKTVVANLAQPRNEELFWNGEVQWFGGTDTFNYSLPGIPQNALVYVTIKVPGSVPIFAVAADVAPDEIVFTAPQTIPDDVTMNVRVCVPSAIKMVDIGQSFPDFGTTSIMQNGDVIFTDFVYRPGE